MSTTSVVIKQHFQNMLAAKCAAHRADSHVLVFWRLVVIIKQTVHVGTLHHLHQYRSQFSFQSQETLPRPTHTSSLRNPATSHTHTMTTTTDSSTLTVGQWPSATILAFYIFTVDIYSALHMRSFNFSVIFLVNRVPSVKAVTRGVFWVFKHPPKFQKKIWQTKTDD